MTHHPITHRPNSHRSTTRRRHVALATLVSALAVVGVAGCQVSDEVAQARPVDDAPAQADAAADARAGVTYLVECVDTEYRVEPRSFVLTCGDGNQSLDRLDWTGWGADSASATGVVEENSCEPTCVDGEQRSYPVQVVASDLVEGEASATYRTLTVTATGDRPEGTPEAQTFTLPGNPPGEGAAATGGS